MKNLKDKHIRQFSKGGFRVIPLNGKIPQTGWPKTEYTLKPDLSKFPGNYGLALDDDVIVIDVDPRNYKDGVDSFKKLCTDLMLPLKKMAKCKQKTGGGGQHLFFKNPTKARVKNHIPEYPGIEFKSIGRQVVGPGSIHPDTGKPYELLKGSDPTKEKLLPFPEELLEMVKRDTRLVFEQGLTEYDDSDGTIETVKNLLANHPEAIEGDNGDMTTFQAACIGKDQGISPDMNLELLEEYYNPRCQPPWDVRDLHTKVRNAYRYGQNAPGALNPKSDFDMIEDKDGKDDCQYCQFKTLKPLPPERAAVPSMDESILPLQFKDFLPVYAAQLCVPLEYLAISLAVSCGAIIGRQVLITPRPDNDWMVPPNLWGLIVGPPSVKKTPCLEVATQHLKALSKREIEKYADAQNKYEIEKEDYQKQIKTLESELKTAKNALLKAKTDKEKKLLKAKVSKLVERIEEQEIRFRALNNPVMKRYLVNDVTPEKLGEILRDNPQGVLIYRDEIYGLITSCQRKGYEGYRELLLEGYNGTGSYVYDRITRGTIFIESVCLSILGGIQPSKLNKIVRGVIQGGVTDDGLLQRFQLFVWPDALPPYERSDKKHSDETLAGIEHIFSRLAEIKSEYRLDFDMFDDDGILVMGFSPDAQAVFEKFLDENELEVRSNALKDRPALVSHIGKYNSLVPKLALIFHLLDVVTDKSKSKREISKKALKLALRWITFLRAHAEKLYFDEAEPDIKPARLLADKIVKGRLMDGTRLRDIKRYGWSGLSRSDDVERGIELLESLGWVAIEVKQGNGEPSKIIRLNPDAKNMKLE